MSAPEGSGATREVGGDEEMSEERRQFRERFDALQAAMERKYGKRVPPPRITRSKEEQELIRATLWEDQYGFWHDRDGFASRELVEAAGLTWWTEDPEFVRWILEGYDQGLPRPVIRDSKTSL